MTEASLGTDIFRRSRYGRINRKQGANPLLQLLICLKALLSAHSQGGTYDEIWNSIIGIAFFQAVHLQGSVESDNTNLEYTMSKRQFWGRQVPKDHYTKGLETVFNDHVEVESFLTFYNGYEADYEVLSESIVRALTYGTTGARSLRYTSPERYHYYYRD